MRRWDSSPGGTHHGQCRHRAGGKRARRRLRLAGGGAIAAATARGDRAVVVCLSYGERGESASQWLAGKSLDEIKAIRRGEAEAAAEALGAEIEFLDAGDYPSCRAGNCWMSWCGSTAGSSPPLC